MSQTQNFIDLFLSRPLGIDSIQEVKNAVANEFRSVSPNVIVEDTHYFNHGHVPDLVARWGSLSNESRPIFLRFDVMAPNIPSDIDRLASLKPLFYSLRPRKNGDVPEGVISEVNKNSKTLVTSSDGIEALVGAPEHSFEGLITEYLVEAGKGLLDEESTARSTANMARSSTGSTPCWSG